MMTDDDCEEEREVCDHFYDGVDPQMPSPKNDFGWDFFYSIDGVRRTEVVNGIGQSSDDDLRAVREAEGIPELEEEEDEERESFREREAVMADGGGVGQDEDEDGVEGLDTVGDANVSQGEHKGLKVIDRPTNGRELLEALGYVENHFIRAYDSGVDVSKMLETSMVHLQSDFEEIKESPNKLVQSITWRRSTSSRSSSSIRQQLGRLYAWEKKLYEEVKVGEQTRKIYERKCSQLRNKDAGGQGLSSVDKTGDEVRDLHSRILVALRSAESISKRIQKLRDDELQPQLVELFHGLMRTWKIMLESYETQKRTMFEVKSFTCAAYGKFCNDSHRLATLQLEAELQNWRACFVGYVSAQKAYVEALSGWLSKFITPQVEFSGKSSLPPYKNNGPPMLVTCHDWLATVEKLPDKLVMNSMKSFGKDIRALWAQQGEEQQQKRKVNELAKELDRRVLAFQREECKILESKLSDQKTEVDIRHWAEYLAERKSLLDMFRKRLDAEKVKHQDSMQQTQRITLNGFQTGFSSVFESLTEFSKASVKMYADLVAQAYSESAKMGDKNGDHPSFIGGTESQVEANNGWKMEN
ncbi:hypothetical protein F0562_006838 [Nyssa sinensis]|uniref:DUF632 domain-containing protein n=1 Tax=Nyssa sinensis TaxID=561372 RepID=A0A5J5AMY4_9ASTE|nr:hypothetical protein F0562_006838 [Nyssa sinensis]